MVNLCQCCKDKHLLPLGVYNFDKVVPDWANSLGVFQCDFRCFCQNSNCELLVHDVILNSDDSFMAGREAPYGPKEFSQSPNETPHMAPGIEEV